MKTRQSGFTLIELLAVVAIIGVLAALITSQVGKAIDRSKATQCLNNMRQLGAAAMACGADNNLQFPGSVHGRSMGIKSWRLTLPPYFLSDKESVNFNPNNENVDLRTFQCPCDKDRDRKYAYIINDFLDMTSSAKVNSPAETFLFAEAVETADPSVDHFHFSEFGGGAISSATFEKDVAVEGTLQRGQLPLLRRPRRVPHMESRERTPYRSELAVRESGHELILLPGTKKTKRRPEKNNETKPRSAPRSNRAIHRRDVGPSGPRLRRIPRHERNARPQRRRRARVCQSFHWRAYQRCGVRASSQWRW